MQLDLLLSDLAPAPGKLPPALHTLVHAGAVALDDVALSGALRHLVRAAQELTAARYVALSVLGRDGLAREFIYVGMDVETVQRIGRLPSHDGVLGTLLDDPRPLRTAEIDAHPAAIGFPPHHPVMRSFLGVPIRVAGRVRGSLYLAESGSGRFSVGDERLVSALAEAAAVLIGNADLFEEA